MKLTQTLVSAAACAALALAAQGCSKKSSNYSASTVATSTSSSTTLLSSSSSSSSQSSSAGAITSAPTQAQPPVSQRPRGNTGSGVFMDASASFPDSSTDDFGVAAADFDGDGDLDLMIAANAAASRVLENDGGNFSVKLGAFPSLVMRATDVHAGDLDKDGDLDLVVSSNFEPVRVFQNDGTGSFRLIGSYAADNDCYTYKIALADFDGDGALDVFMGNAGPYAPSKGQNRLLLGDGRGGFAEAAAGALPTIHDATVGVTALDFDQDGDIDIFAANFGNPHRLLVNDGQGRFSDGSDAFLPALTTTYGTSVEAADFDGDGYLDLFIGNQGPPQNGNPPAGEANQLLLGSIGGRFRDATGQIPSHPDSTFDLRAFDADGDGKIDLVPATLRNTQRLYLNQGGRLVDASANLPALNATPSRSLSVEAADFNGDGALDLLYLQRNAKPFYFLNVPRTAASNAP